MRRWDQKATFGDGWVSCRCLAVSDESRKMLTNNVPFSGTVCVSASASLMNGVLFLA